MRLAGTRLQREEQIQAGPAARLKGRRRSLRGQVLSRAPAQLDCLPARRGRVAVCLPPALPAACFRRRAALLACFERADREATLRGSCLSAFKAARERLAEGALVAPD